jgi:hypothetical protein
MWATTGYIAPDFHWDICFDGHSRFLGIDGLFTGDVRGVISVRDPRDVVVSSALYHMKASEKWLHIPKKQFGDKTYQQTICALGSDEERFLFEMNNYAKRTIRRMLGFDRSDPRLRLVKLEQLMADRELEEFRAIFAFLGFRGEALETCVAIARERSVFSDGFKPTAHVRHTTPALWKERFTPELAKEFEKRFPHAAEKLGYEPTFVG